MNALGFNIKRSLQETQASFWSHAEDDGSMPLIRRCFLCTWKRGPSALVSEAIREDRLVERKVYFGCWQPQGKGVRGYCCWETKSPITASHGARDFIGRSEGGTCRNNAVSSGGHVEGGHPWSDQYHLDSCKYGWSSLPGWVCSRLLEASSRNDVCLCLGVSLVVE